VRWTHPRVAHTGQGLAFSFYDCTRTAVRASQAMARLQKSSRPKNKKNPAVGLWTRRGMPFPVLFPPQLGAKSGKCKKAGAPGPVPSILPEPRPAAFHSYVPFK